MRCKNKTCMFVHLGRGCSDDKDCEGFVPPSLHDKICSMNVEDMAKLIESMTNYDCTECPLLERCRETENYCEDVDKLIWLNLPAE